MAAVTNTYPATDFFKALHTLKPSFDITDVDGLYVNFDSVRSESLSSLMLKLGIMNGRISDDTYAKILYMGHTGCGKSTELAKLHHKLHTPEQYFSVYLNLEDYIQISDFKSEDLIIFLIASLVNALEEYNINYEVAGLQKIAEDWLSDKEVNEEIKSKIDNEGGASGELGTGGFLKFFSAKTYIKSAFSYGSQTSNIVRRKVQDKQGDYIVSFNLALIELRKAIRLASKGQEIVFILDGLEKLRWDKYETYTRSILYNAKLINDLNCSLICSVPIDTYYDSRTSQVLSLYDQFILPLIPINHHTIPLFSEVITRRIDEHTFFEKDVLEYCVRKSGGNARQLIKIVETALYSSEANNFKISMQIAEKACHKLGHDLSRRLTSPQFEILIKRDYEHADQNILDLLFSLSLMEYNGNENNRKPNPLLKPFLKDGGA